MKQGSLDFPFNGWACFFFGGGVICSLQMYVVGINSRNRIYSVSMAAIATFGGSKKGHGS